MLAYSSRHLNPSLRNTISFLCHSNCTIIDDFEPLLYILRSKKHYWNDPFHRYLMLNVRNARPFSRHMSKLLLTFNLSMCTSLFSWPLPSTTVVASLKYFPMNFLRGMTTPFHDRFVEVAGPSTEMYTRKSAYAFFQQNAHDPFAENALFRLVAENTA